jgi:hypothetical protein
MNRVIRGLFLSSICLLIAAVATWRFGVKYDLSQMPPETREVMEESIWVGFRWIVGASVLLLLSILSTTFGIVLLFAQRLRTR